MAVEPGSQTHASSEAAPAGEEEPEGHVRHVLCEGVRVYGVWILCAWGSGFMVHGLWFMV